MSVTRGLLVVFEGIDGSGKTTISNRVAAALRAGGLTVEHVRESGRLASDTAERIRQFTRDQRQAGLGPFAELLLYVAREQQQLEERVLPALARADVVIGDRFFHTAEVLARFGRGLPRQRVAAVVDAARDGLEPHVTVLIDVDPHVARARRRADKIARPAVRTSSRKGLSGAGLMHRLRDGYLQLAAADPDRWIVVDNTATDLDALVGELAAWIRAAVHAGLVPGWVRARPRHAAGVRPAAGGARDLVAARAELFAWIDAAAAREPEVAAYFLSGLAGEGVDRRRQALAAAAPAVVAAGLRGQDDGVSWQLRQALAPVCPEQVAASLADLPAAHDEAWALRRRLVERAPAAVALSLAGLADARAFDLRAALWPVVPDAVVRSLAGDASPAAWMLRDAWLDAVGGEAALADPERARTLCASLAGLGGARAWRLRRLARDASPVGALLSLAGLDDERAWRWRERWVARAPRPVLATIAGMTGARAWALREATLATSKEALDTVVGLDDERAWALRARAVDLWPSTVVKSLAGLGRSGRGRDLVERQLARHPGNLSLLKHAAALADGGEVRHAAAG